MEILEIVSRGRRDLGLGALVNMTDGGDGASGYVMSPEQIAKIANSKLGKPLSAECRAKISKTRTGAQLSDDHRANISLGLMGRVPTAETRAKLSAIHKGRIISPEQITQIVATMTGRTLLPSHVENMRAAVLLRYESPAEREKSAKAAHKIPPHKTNTSGFKGVSFRNGKGVWRAGIMIDGIQRALGVFKTPEAAAQAYDAAAFAAWGHDCYLNFPIENSQAA